MPLSAQPLRTLACAVHLEQGVYELHIVGCSAADVALGLKAVAIRPYVIDPGRAAITADRVDTAALATLTGRDLELVDQPTALPTILLDPLVALAGGRLALAAHADHLTAWTRDHGVVVAILGAWLRARVLPGLAVVPDVEALAEPIASGTWVELAAVRRRGRFAIAVHRPRSVVAASAR